MLLNYDIITNIVFDVKNYINNNIEIDEMIDVIEYALIHYHDKRGNKAADVLAFDCNYSHKIIKKEKNDK